MLTIRDKRGKLIPFDLNTPQRIISERKERARRQGRPGRFLIPKARRLGVTTYSLADQFYWAATATGYRALTLADTDQKTRDLFEVARAYHSGYVDRCKLVIPAEDKGSQTRIRFSSHGSQMALATAGASAPGRGSTLQAVHGSEVAYWLKGRAQDQVEVMIVGLTEAASHGEVTLESTSNGNTGWWYDNCTAANSGDSEWELIFLPWFVMPEYRLPITSKTELEEIRGSLSDREKWLIEAHELGLDQIKWRRAKSTERAMRRLFLQEYPETLAESFLTASTCFFAHDCLAEIERGCTDGESNGRGLTQWAAPVEGRRYVIGADSAEGLPEGDWSVAYVIDHESGEVVARLRGKFGPSEFGDQLESLAKQYNRAMLAVERENHGHAVLQHLMGPLGYGNLYATSEVKTDRTMGSRSRPKLKYGWSTNGRTRPVMLGDLREALEEGDVTVPCREVLREARVFEHQGDGKYAARDGQHDDCVMALAIAWQARKWQAPNYEVTVF